MNIKMTTLLFALVVGTTSAFAQIAKEDRYGHGQDSLDCLANISLYSEHVKVKNYADAYEPWKKVFYKHPVARNDMYDFGADILRWKINSEADETKRAELINELLGIYDQRIQYLESLNSFLKRPLTKVSILEKRAHDFITFNKPKTLKDWESSYAMLADVLNSDPANAGHQIMLDLMKFSSTICKNKETHKEQMVKDYLMVSDQVANRIETNTQGAAKGDANQATYEKIVKMWEQVKGNVDAYFINSGAADCESLQAIYAPQVEENKDNLEFLKQVVSIMAMLKCNEQEAYMAAAEYAHNIEPTSRSAAGCAARYLKRGDAAKAIEFMDQAIELETSDAQKAEYAYKTAQILYSTKQLSKAKSYANKAISLKNDFGAPYILIAQMYASSPKWSDEPAMNKCTYFAAIDKLARAKAVDPSVTEEANKLIGSYSAYTPKPEDLFFIGLKKGDSVTIGGWINETTTIR